MSILKLLFALNPKNLKLMKAEKMTPDMANEIDSFLGKIGAVVNIGKYKLTPKQAKFWVDQRKELTRYENKLKELQDKNKLKKREGIKTLPEADVIDFPVKPKPPEGEPFAIGGRVGFKKGGNYWLMVQEAYDAAGGEEQTGLSLFDFANKYFPKMADGGSIGMNVDGYKKGGSVKKSLSEKIINLLGGKDATAAELGLLGMEQLYNLLGLPFYANGGAVGMPPISTSDPKQAGKIIIDSFLGSSVENIPLYQGNGLGITAGIGLGNQRPFDYGVGFNYGNFQGGVQMNQGNPSFGIGYRKEFSNGGGVKSGPPPERGPNPQGLETLFQKR